ncbi:thioesterase family protein [Nocardia farcinica]|uniref:thioesterase family protein n=1 Tax=Nocardia farcinica TaxID=37329 RepID=UPI002457F18C|nr:thioesterase family protein [Nocardia farcinica]
MTETTEPDHFFRRTGAHRFVPTARTGGAWSADEQHFSPISGLLLHEIERVRADDQQRPALLMSRISYDILGRIGVEEFDIEVEVVRPGRTIELVQATAVIGGRPTVTARVWLLTAVDTAAVAGGAPDPLPHPETLEPWPLSSVWPGGYIAALDARPVTPPRPGRTAAWVSTPVDLVADEKASDLASFLALVDTANGIAVRRDPREWMFPNVDLTIHLYRQPSGPWTGLDTTVTWGADGQGLTSTVLHDIHGPVGRAEQILTVRPQHG